MGNSTSDDDASVAEVLQLLPSMPAPDRPRRLTTSARRGGRDPAELEAVRQERAQRVAADPVVMATEGSAEPVEILRRIRGEVAREAAALAHQRELNEISGKDTSQLSSRRIDALMKVASIEFEIKKLGVDMIDLKGERFQRVFKLWIDTLQKVCADVLPSEQADMFFNRLESAFEGWEEAASEAMNPTAPKR